MKEVMRFMAEVPGAEDHTDAFLFRTPEEARNYEALFNTVQDIMSALPPRPQETEFSNGRLGYLQHDFNTLVEVRAKLLRLMLKFTDHHWVHQSLDNPTVHADWAGRIIGEQGQASRPLQDAWYRFHMIQMKTSREYGQPYFIEHPEESDAVGVYKKPA